MVSSSKTLGERIRELRRLNKLSMRQLAAKANLRSAAFIADMEKGFRHPSPEVLNNLAEALEVPPQDLRFYDPRAPLHEIRDLTAQNPAWAAAFRKVVDAANAGSITPASLARLVERAGDESAQASLQF